MKLRIQMIDLKGSVADGPGMRSVVFFQGCDRKVKCPGCHNGKAQDIAGGKLMSVRDVVKILKTSPFRRVTLSGGEPLAQREGLEDLVKALKDERFEIALYTWRDEKEVPSSVLRHIDYLKTGEFVLGRKSSTIPYVGSSNQVFKKVA